MDQLKSKNLKPLITILVILCAILALPSCQNTISKSLTTKIPITLPQEQAETVTRTITQVQGITEETELTINCILLSNKTVYRKEAKTTKLQDLYKTELVLSEVPLNNNYQIKVEILYKGNLLFQAESEIFLLPENPEEISIILPLEEHYNTITYKLNGGTFEKNANPPANYYMDENLTIPAPIKDGNLFEGWYSNPSFTGEKLTTLGTENYLGDVTLYAKWHNQNPENVTNLKLTQSDGKINLEWTPPADKDFAKVIISYGESPNYNNLTEVTKENNTFTLDGNKAGLTSEKTYIFTVTAYDTENNHAENSETNPGSTQEIQYNPYNLTLKPKEITGYKSPRLPETVRYIKFGDWPQSVKKENITIDPAQTPVKINNWQCYKGSDKKYYVKLTAHPYYDPSKPAEDSFNLDKTFYSDPQRKIEKGVEYYFQLEPIVWAVVNPNYNGSNLLITDFVLSNVEYSLTPDDRQIEGQTVIASNYKYSNVRAYLTSKDGSSYGARDYTKYDGTDESKSTGKPSFLNGAFTATAQALINDTELKDSDNVKDKVFLLAKNDQELQCATGGCNFITLEGRDDRNWHRDGIASDYSASLGSLISGTTQYATRSSYGIYVHYVSFTGKLGHYKETAEKFSGIKPGICLKESVIEK